MDIAEKLIADHELSEAEDVALIRQAESCITEIRYIREDLSNLRIIVKMIVIIVESVKEITRQNDIG